MPQLTHKYRWFFFCIVNFYCRLKHPSPVRSHTLCHLDWTKGIYIYILYNTHSNKKSRKKGCKWNKKRQVHHAMLQTVHRITSIPDHSSDFVIHSFRTYKYIIDSYLSYTNAYPSTRTKEVDDHPTKNTQLRYDTNQITTTTATTAEKNDDWRENEEVQKKNRKKKHTQSCPIIQNQKDTWFCVT